MTSIDYNQRGYNYTNSNNPYGDDRRSRGGYWDGTGTGRGRRYTFTRNYDEPAVTNDCAMMCDQSGWCKSFTVATDPGTDPSRNDNKGITTCYLNLDKSTGWTTPNTARNIQNVKNYDKNGQVSAPGENFSAVFDTDLSHNADTTATDYCTGSDGCCNQRDTPEYQWTSSRLVRVSQGNGDNSIKCGTWDGAGAPACKNPGVVTRTTNDNGALVAKIRCGYNRFDTGWMRDNWANLGSFGLDANNLEAAKRAHCNGLTFDELANDITQCPTVSGFNKNLRLLETISNNWYLSDIEIARMRIVVDSVHENIAGGQGAITKINDMLSKIPINITWTPRLISLVNHCAHQPEITSAAVDVSTRYCATRMNDPECGCFKDTINWNLKYCAGNSCNNQGNAFGSALASTTDQRIKNILQGMWVPGCLSSECQDNTKLYVGPPVNPCVSTTLNSCQTQIIAGGSITDSKVSSVCNFDKSAGAGTVNTVAPTPGSNGADGTTGSNGGADGTTGSDGKSTITYIIIAIVCCLLLIGVGLVIAVSL